MELASRLKAIVNLVNKPCNLIDVGTDHAYLPIYLAKNYQFDKLIASEVNTKPYQFALENIKKHALKAEIELRLGFGLSVLAVEEVNTAVIAGMGARSIIDILTADYKLASSISQLVLQPMKGSALLREWLVNNGFQIADEVLVKEKDRFYEIIEATPGQEVVEEELLLEIGPRLREKETANYKEFLLTKEAEWRSTLKRLPSKEVAELEDKRAALKTKLLKLREVI